MIVDIIIIETNKKEMIIKMATKTLIMYEDHEEERMLTTLVGNTHEETLYAEFACNDGESVSYDTIELAVHVDEMIKIRDYLTKLIEAI